MAAYLGGMTIVKAGWLGQRSLFVEFVSDYTSGWLWQLYANRTLIGRTSSPRERRVVGQLLDAAVPAPLTLLRVDSANALTDYGASLPAQPWNRFALEWTAAGYPSDAHHFEVTGSLEAGEAVDADNVLANIPFTGNGPYRFVLPPLASAGDWSFAITPRDDALPAGNAGTVEEVTITAAVPPPDLPFDDEGDRFTLSAEAGVVTAAFSYVG